MRTALHAYVTDASSQRPRRAREPSLRAGGLHGKCVRCQEDALPLWTSGKGWEQQRPAGMNNLERDSKQYDVLVMEMSTQEKTVRDSDQCVPVKHVAKLNRMRGQTSTKTNIKFFVDREEENRDNDTTPDSLGSKPSDLEDDVCHNCSWCEAGGNQWKRTRNLSTKKPSVRFSSSKDADINFFEQGGADPCELQQSAWSPLPKPLVVDSGAGETVMPVDWLTNHPLTESDRFKSQ